MSLLIGRGDRGMGNRCVFVYTDSRWAGYSQAILKAMARITVTLYRLHYLFAARAWARGLAIQHKFSSSLESRDWRYAFAFTPLLLIDVLGVRNRY